MLTDDFFFSVNLPLNTFGKFIRTIWKIGRFCSDHTTVVESFNPDYVGPESTRIIENPD